MTERHRSGTTSDLDTLRVVLDHTSDVVWCATADGTIAWVNAAFSQVLGWSSSVIVGRPLANLIHPDDRAAAERAQIAGQSGLTVSSEVRFECSDGTWHVLRIRTAPMPNRGESSAPTHLMVGIGSDRTETRDLSVRLARADEEVERLRAELSQTRRQLRTAREQSLSDLESIRRRFALAMHHAPIGMALVGLDGSFLDVNPALCHIVRYSPEELAGLTFQDITHPDDLASDLDLLQQLLMGEITNYRMDKRYIRKDGTTVWVELQVSLVRNGDGTPEHFVSQIVDIDDRREEYASLSFKAHHDPLTGLVNRSGLLAALHRLDMANSDGTHPFAVIYCDIDGFKLVNDRAGHAAGDALLREIAGRISHAVRSGDTVARIGGDEFIVALDRTPDVPAAVAVADKIRAAVARPLAIAGITRQITISAGVASSLDGGSSPDDIVRRADEALYRAKREGRNRVLAAAPEPPTDAEPA